MIRNVFIYLFISLFLVGCGGIAEENTIPVPFGQVPTGEDGIATGPVGPEATNTPVEGDPTEVAEVQPTEPPATITPAAEDQGTPEPPVFRQLRFASASDGVSQVTFLSGTEEIYALWDYTGVTNGNTMRRIWYLNDELYVERSEEIGRAS